MGRKMDADIYRPNKEQIKEACQEIQRGWSDEERAKRERYCNPNPVEITSIEVSSIER